METFTICLGRCWIFRAFGRNPLVRMSDRAEALVLVFVLAAALVIAPVAGVMGTAVHDARAQLYAEESQSRHPFTAAVIEDTTTTIEQTDVVVTALLQPGRGRR
jgi:hypothetical protein